MTLPFNLQKRWNDKCPICGAIIKWHLSSSITGAKSGAYCSNNMKASKVDITSSWIEIDYCLWEGRAIRQEDGGIRLSNKNGEWIKETKV